ncbi:T9SS type A sorting domain-containing protein, partial [Bacteroidota bacterium]
RSIDHGINWSPANAGQDSFGVSCILIKDSSLFAGTGGGGVYRSTDYGASWAPANNGMTSNTVNSLAVFDTAIFAGTWWGEGLYRSTDEGMTWEPVKSNVLSPDVNTLAVLDTNLFAGTHGGVYLSSDRSENWTLLDNGPLHITNCLHVSDSDIFAGTFDGIYVSSDTGDSWSRVSTGLITTSIDVITRKDTFLFAGTENSGLYRSDDEGATWVKTNLQSYNSPISSLVTSGTYIFAGSSHVGVQRSSNNGDTWISVNLGLPAAGWIRALAVSGSNLFAGTDSSGVFLSTNGGASWIPVNSGLTNMNVRCLYVSGTNLFAGTGDGAFISTNYGTSWTPISTGLVGEAINVFASNDAFLFAGTGSGLFHSDDDGATWIKTNLPSSYDALSLVANDTIIYSGSSSGVVSCSSNNGATWTTVDQGLIKYSILALEVSDTNLFAGTSGSGVWKRPLSEMNASAGDDFALNETVCHGEIIPALSATGDSIKWYGNPDFTGLLHSGNTYETGQTEPGTYTYYVTQLIGSIELKDTASLIISSNPVISSIEKTNLTTCTSDDGTITITATDEYPLLYSINGGNDFFDNGGNFSALSNGNYSVVVMNSNHCETSGETIEIISGGAIPPAPVAGSDTTYCIGDVIKDLYAIASSGGTLTWYSDPGLTNAIGTGPSFNPGILSAITSFYVTETKNGCESPSTKVTLDVRNTAPYEDEKICIVTADITTGKNLIVWEKTPDVGTEFFNIYRDNENTLIGTVPFHELSVFRDTLVDPETRPYLYFLSTVDSCGNESELSPYHKPLFLQYTGSVNGVNLQWNKYEIEDGSINFISYSILRGLDLSDLSDLAINIPTPINVYTDKDLQATINKYYYRVAGVLYAPCTPDGDKKAGTGPYQHSLSNMDDNKLKESEDTTGTYVYPLVSEDMFIYPNPFNHSTTITFPNQSNELYRLVLTDLSGKVCRMVDGITTSEYVLEKGDLKNGLYFIELRGPKLYRGKIVIE